MKGEIDTFLLRPANEKLTQGFEPSEDAFDRQMKILVVGAGGLGCELLKDLALTGFEDIHIIDMDTIDVSNLNRQFLFRPEDVGKAKAEVAASAIMARIPKCTVTPYYKKIEDMDADFYQNFMVVICGLDSINARRWLNAMICGLARFTEDGQIDQTTIKPLVDGGTEGFKGNVRLILPGITPCIECELSLYPPQQNFPLCTIAHTPRLPEHCVEYVRILLWPKEDPFNGEEIDGDNPEHIQWIFEKSLSRAEKYGIKGVTYRLTQGVVKRIIPAVASTNAIVSALCVQEVFKLATNCSLFLNNYLNFQDIDGVSTNVVSLERNENCAVCSSKPQYLDVSSNAKLQDIFDKLTKDTDFMLKSPGIYMGTKSLYIPTIPSLEEQTRPNLKKTLCELEIVTGSLIMVADVTRPNPIEVSIKLIEDMETEQK